MGLDNAQSKCSASSVAALAVIMILISAYSVRFCVGP